VILARVQDRNPAHVRVLVYIGSDFGGFVYTGELTFGAREWEADARHAFARAGRVEDAAPQQGNLFDTNEGTP
jgi:hypothetical protein